MPEPGAAAGAIRAAVTATDHTVDDRALDAGPAQAVDAETLHRSDQKVVETEILAAGFVLDGQSDVLRNPDDARDWNSSPRAAGERRGTSDRFVLRFVKPKK